MLIMSGCVQKACSKVDFKVIELALSFMSEKNSQR